MLHKFDVTAVAYQSVYKTA